MNSSPELQPFSQRTALALIGLGAVAFLAMAYFMIAGESGQRPASPTSTSRSAIGYRAFVELLRRFGMPAASPTASALAAASLRIVLDPKSPQDVRQALAAAPPPVMIVLPKWRSYVRSFGDSVDGARLLDATAVRALAREIAEDIEVVRPEAVGPWQNEGVEGEPTLRRPQLVRSASLCPLVSSNDGVLIGRLCKRPSVIVLADPDLLANHGLWRGDNAVLALSVVERLRAGTGPVVALEAVNDLPPSPSIWRLAFSPPFVLITFAAGVAAGIALWLAAMRFGPPAVEEQERSPGVISLIDVATRLLRDKADGRGLLQRYTDLVILDLGRRLHAPRQLQGAAAIGGWLDSSRGATPADLTYRELARKVDAIERGEKTAVAAAVAVAAQFHRWREDLLNGR